jgi:hypothetical protein
MHSGPNHGAQQIAVIGLLTDSRPELTLNNNQKKHMNTDNVSNELPSHIA